MLLKNPLLMLFLALVIVVVYINMSRSLTLPQIFELKELDNFFRWRLKYYKTLAKDYTKPKDVVLVTINEESYERLVRKWPWERDVYADFIDKLSKYEPKVIAFNFALYAQTPDNSEADAKLKNAIARSGKVIIASVKGKEGLYLGHYGVFARAARESGAGYGVIGEMRDVDNSIRRLTVFTPVLVPPEGEEEVTFEVKAAASYLDIPYDRMYQKGQDVILRSRNKRIVIPIDKDGNFWINYISDEEDIETIPIWKVMAGDIPEGIFKGKLVLLSQTGKIFHDQHMTPVGYKSSGLITANALNSIISSSYLKKGNPKLIITVIIFLYLFSLVFFYRSHPLKGFFVLIFIMAAYTATSFSLFLNGIIWPTFDIMILLPFLFFCMTFYKYTIIILERARLKKKAITDFLTSLYTHRYFRLLIEHTVERAVSTHHQCSLIVIKILNLNRIIKEISFNRGQIVQRGVAEVIKIKLPKGGSASHLAMGEFSMLLPKIGLSEALGIAGSLRDRINETYFNIHEEALKPIVAIGVSAVNHGGFPKTGEELMKSARVAMTRAKKMGYNKVCRFNAKVDSFTFETGSAQKEDNHVLDDEFNFLTVDLEERNKEFEDLLRQLSKARKDLELAHFDTLRSLVIALEEKDPISAGHSERVGEYAEKIGRKLKMPEEELELLEQIGILHDIGKVGIPQNILRKEGSLSEVERQIVELHPGFSVKILKTSKYFNKHLNAIRDHHERLDGSGYPRGRKSDEISLEAQIIAVCDVFDALTTYRPYRKELSCTQALQEILPYPEKYNHSVAVALEGVLKDEHKI